MKFYSNGANVGTSIVDAALSIGPVDSLSIGKLGIEDVFCHCVIDAVEIYQRVVGEDEVQKLITRTWIKEQ